MIKLLCPKCGRKLHVGDEMAGRKGRCPQCRAVISIPPADEGALDWMSLAELAEGPRVEQPERRRGSSDRDAAAPPAPKPTALAPSASAQIRRNRDVSTWDLIKTPFSGELVVRAALMTVVWLVMNLAVGAALALQQIVRSRWLTVVFGLSALVMFFGWLGWVARKYVSVVEVYEAGFLQGETTKSKAHCLGLSFAVLLISTGIQLVLVLPLILLGGLTGGPMIAVIGLGSLSGSFYGPMAFGMASAYGTFSPLAVMKKIAVSFRLYLAVWTYTVAVGAAALLSGGFVSQYLSAKLPDPLGLLLAVVVFYTFLQYGILTGCAMIGRLLRRLRQ